MTDVPSPDGDTNPRGGGDRYLSICTDCTPALPQPFRFLDECSTWSEAHHKATDHRILILDSRKGDPRD